MRGERFLKAGLEKEMAGWLVDWLTVGPQYRHLRRLLLNGCLSEQLWLLSVPLL